MKKIIYALIIMILVCGCGKKLEKPKKYERQTRTMLTCEENNITYMFYFEDEEKSYYKATYLEKKSFKTEKEAEKYQEEFQNNWNELYLDELMTVDYKIEEKKSFINVSAIPSTPENIYKDFFGDRYNLNMDDINKSFNNNCLIKPIKK